MNLNLTELLKIENPCGKMIAIHCVIEDLISDFISLSLMQPDYLEKLHLSHMDRVNLAMALGLSPDIYKPLKAIATIRNKFAHQLDKNIDKSMINEFFKSFPSKGKDCIFSKDYILNMGKELNVFGFSEGKTWKKLESDDQFILLIISLCYFLKHEIDKYQFKKEIEQKDIQLGRQYLTISANK
ncbi:hypothetical protein [Photobacterium kishitanii]|uniref:hypothetical protein n=1 Tax=Photobacterium kishitanii TaxID=318456 RepID=UPI000D17840C|nr:hypothetical protein [Photobacterium kishitanii]PSV14622.1 hypothetical protein C0W28_16645 [Photobacterium kishitanii]